MKDSGLQVVYLDHRDLDPLIQSTVKSEMSYRAYLVIHEQR